MLKRLFAGRGPGEGDRCAGKVCQRGCHGEVVAEPPVESGHPQESHEGLPCGRSGEGWYGLHVGLLTSYGAIPDHMSQIAYRRLAEAGFGQVNDEPSLL